MNEPNSTPDNVYNGVYHTLVIGMTVATTLFAIGVALTFIRLPFLPAATATWLMIAGTVVTIFTPIARVVVSLFAFLADGDRTFVWITALVLAATLLSVALGMLGFRA